MRNILLLFVLVSVVTGCGRQDAGKSDAEPDSLYLSTAEYQVLATLYTQTAGEYRALCHQAFNLARRQLASHLDDVSVKPLAVVLDIDETVLDNSPYQALCITKGIAYPECWDEWCSQAVAQAVPGVTEFLGYARSVGVEVFFITNRKEHLRDVTISNLSRLGLEEPDTVHLLMRTGENSKEERRGKVLKEHAIVLYIGDNLADFSLVFETGDGIRRNQLTDSLAAAFGERFIILPNAMYGDWVAALPGFSYDLDREAAREARFRALNPAICEPE